VAAVAALAGCGADRASWSEKADAICTRTGARVAALGRPESIDQVGPLARRTASALGAAGAEVARLERPEKDPDITRVTRGFGKARRGLTSLADAVARGDERAAILTLRGLERERLRWSDAAVAVGMRRCGSAQRLSIALDALRKPLYAHSLGPPLREFTRYERRAYRLAEQGGPRTQQTVLVDASFALHDLQARLGELDPPRSLAAQIRAWSARLDALDESSFDLEESMERPDSQATVDRRYAALRRAIRAENTARAQVLREVDLSDSLPVLPPEASEA
jgi:hypothetical protein